MKYLMIFAIIAFTVVTGFVLFKFYGFVRTHQPTTFEAIVSTVALGLYAIINKTQGRN